MYTITFHDGTKLEGLELDGGTFTREAEIDRELIMRANGLRNITIESDNPEETYLLGTHERLQEFGLWFDPYINRWCLILREPEPATTEQQLQANVAYIAMMMGVEL